MNYRRAEIAVLTFVCKWMLRFNGMLIKMLGRRLDRNVDPQSGKDRKTGARL